MDVKEGVVCIRNSQVPRGRALCVRRACLTPGVAVQLLAGRITKDTIGGSKKGLLYALLRGNRGALAWSARVCSHAE